MIVHARVVGRLQMVDGGVFYREPWKDPLIGAVEIAGRRGGRCPPA
jgi:hypothetical protein